MQGISVARPAKLCGHPDKFDFMVENEVLAVVVPPEYGSVLLQQRRASHRVQSRSPAFMESGFDCLCCLRIESTVNPHGSPQVIKETIAKTRGACPPSSWDHDCGHSFAHRTYRQDSREIWIPRCRVNSRLRLRRALCNPRAEARNNRQVHIRKGNNPRIPDYRCCTSCGDCDNGATSNMEAEGSYPRTRKGSTQQLEISTSAAEHRC
jgi:hypothetical protein